MARGKSGKVIYKRQGQDGFGEWHPTFSDFDTPYAPAIVPLDGNSLLALAVRSGDKALMKRRYDAATGWDANWSRLGNADSFTSGPDASLRDGGRIDVVIRGAGGRVNHISRNPEGTWGVFRAVGDLTTAAGVAPAVASRLAGTVDVMARGENGFVHRNIWADGSWSGWNQVHIGQLNQGPDLVPNTGAGELQLLGRNTDGRIVRSVWNPGQGWTGPNPVPNN
ncbi:MAG TPA: hypothetical protein VF062_28275 [Candidatus Limnocylindrales bacterium]